MKYNMAYSSRGTFN